MPSANPSTSEVGAIRGGKLAPLRTVWLDGLRGYTAAWDLQKGLHEQRVRGECPDMLLLLQHAPVVTVGRNGRAGNILVPDGLLRSRGVDLVQTDRGGDVTYHGPGQIVGYTIVDLRAMHQDVHRFLREIEEGIIRAMARWGLTAGRREGKTGVWIGGRKLASIGLKASHWVTMHGFALNVATDLTAFDLIVPCGITDCRMTSMAELLGTPPDLRTVGDAVAEELAGLWNRERTNVEEGHCSWLN
jgi:lipoate-protein ligase B